MKVSAQGRVSNEIKDLANKISEKRVKNYISLRKAKTYMVHFPKVKCITASLFSPILGLAEPTQLIVFMSRPYLDGNCGQPL